MKADQGEAQLAIARSVVRGVLDVLDTSKKFRICFHHHGGIETIEARDLTQARRIAGRLYGKHGYRSVYAA